MLDTVRVERVNALEIMLEITMVDAVAVETVVMVLPRMVWAVNLERFEFRRVRKFEKVAIY